MKQLITSETILREGADLLTDESRFSDGIPDRVSFPQSVDDCRECCDAARRAGAPLCSIGAQTGITGASVPTEGCHAVSFSRMDRIHRIESLPSGELLLQCEPGVTLETIAAFLQNPADINYDIPGRELCWPGHWWYPPDPTEMTAQIGGTVATNASGARSYFFGPTRRYIRSLDILLSTGTMLTCSNSGTISNGISDILSQHGLSLPPRTYRSPEGKNAAGYYARDGMTGCDLIAGSEGTLCLIAGVGIRLLPAPSIVAGLTFFSSRETAITFTDFLRSQTAVGAIEYFDESALRLLSGANGEAAEKHLAFPFPNASALYWEFHESSTDIFDDIMEEWDQKLEENGTSFDHTWSGMEPGEQKKLKDFRHALPESINTLIAQRKQRCPAIRKFGTDTAFPPATFPEAFQQTCRILEEAHLDYAIFGHIGDRHLHCNILPADERTLHRAQNVYSELMQLVRTHGGTVSAEHGIGKLKRDYLSLMYSAEAIAEMKRIKRALDPHWMLNPGVLFACEE